MIVGDGNIQIYLYPKNGGIGRVSLYINDKEIVEDINTENKRSIKFNILDYRDRLYTAGLNTIGVKTYNKDGWLQSKIITLTIDTNIDGEKGTDNEDEKLFSRSKRPRRNQTVKKPGLFGLFVGTSKYQNESLNLNYADKDAEILNDAFQKVSKDM